ncbi:MAG: PGF-CTERM sorting domain-containing protein [Haloarculaceae archaeon]
MSRPSLAMGMTLLLVAVALGASAVGGVAAQEEMVTMTLELVNDEGDTVGGVELTVSWTGGSDTYTTRANGQALVDVPRGSNPTIAVSHDTYMRNFPYEVDNASQGLVQVPVSRSGTVEVTVEGSTGPIDGAAVRLVRKGRNAASAVTGADGTVVTDPVERAEYGLVVGKPGFVTNTTNIQVTGQHERTVRIRPGAVQVQFNVADDHFSPPKPLENARISIEDTGDDLSTLEDGSRGTTAPVNREYTVTVRKDGYESVERTVRVRESARVVNLSISRTPDLNVAVVNERVVVNESTVLTATNEYGEPVADATVRIEGAVVGTTGPDGTLELPVETVGNNTYKITRGSLSNSTVVEGVEAATPTTTTTTASPTPTAGGGPGFTAPLAILSLFVAAGLATAVRRRRRS